MPVGTHIGMRPERVGCVSSTHAQANKILTRLYEFLPTRKVEVGGKVLYNVSSDELFRVIYNTALLPPVELCKQCNLSVKSDPRRYNCPSTKHLNQHLTYHRERMTRYLNSRRGGTSNKVVMSHKQVDLKNPKLKELVIHCGASLMWSNPVREVMLYLIPKPVLCGEQSVSGHSDPSRPAVIVIRRRLCLTQATSRSWKPH